MSASETPASANIPENNAAKIIPNLLENVACLSLPFSRDPFYRLRPPLSHEAMTLSLELASLAYHLEFEDWVNAGWTDISIQIDNVLQSGVVEPKNAKNHFPTERLNNWKLRRAKNALKENNLLTQITGVLRQRERSDTLKAVAMLHKHPDGRYVVAIGFMGTGQRFYDWLSNLRFTTEEGFHKGFNQLTSCFEANADRIFFPDTAQELGLQSLTLRDIFDEMKTVNSRFFLWMSGHSQGSAVMQILAHRLISSRGVLPQNMVGYGFASPTVTCGKFVYDPAAYPLYHVLGSDDLVPRLGALFHLGLCLFYPATEAFRREQCGWNEEQSARKALHPFVEKITDSLTFIEYASAFITCLAEEKGEEGLASLVDSKWTPLPIDKALTYAGGKIQNAVGSFLRYMKQVYLALSGRAIEEEKIDAIREQLRPVVRQFSLRQLLAGLGELTSGPHTLTQNATNAGGAYRHIVLKDWESLLPFIWAKRPAPERIFAPVALWQETAPYAPLRPQSILRRRPPSHFPFSKNVRGRSISARRFAVKHL